MRWTLHWLEATADLGPWKDAVAAELEATWRHIEASLAPPRLDILVQRMPGAGIAEIGLVGHAYRPGLFALTLDPVNPNFEASLHDGTLRRMVVHEVHHCMRMAAIGYGRTLGDALVSEGLAGRFTQWVFGSSPEPWERAVDADTLRAHAPDQAALDAIDYGHDAWFYGVGGQRPRWLGYTMGHQIVGTWLDLVGTPDIDTWVSVPAGTVLAATRGRGGALGS